MLHYLYWCVCLQCTYMSNKYVCQFWDQTLANLENMQKLYVLFDVTWRKNSTLYVIAAVTRLIDISIRNICNQPEVSTVSGSKVRTQCVFVCFWWYWPWPLTYILLVRMTYCLLAKFHTNPSSINGWCGRGHIHTHKHTPKASTIASQIPSGLD